MKTPRLHSVYRSLAHSAGATVIVLAAALASAAPVAADPAPPADGDQNHISSCQTTRVQRQGLQDIVWGLLFGPQGVQMQETRCEEGTATNIEQKQTDNVLRPVLIP
ncbi:hypothetical protein ADK65_20220 [Streptomyces sp. NRRL B-1140]|uniref:hypothetical protein n=1 Tax=Streptomyces sp. NRRL B-1140 TaxID=1415549 RepID=UPI0006BFE926|nr:hypothetical protein [Streptomyces sp. NRRL B-1140]KOV98677.1 hypothetical protein ADK65_20220 [Streptomyces sp. NRRL B-1140]